MHDKNQNRMLQQNALSNSMNETLLVTSIQRYAELLSYPLRVFRLAPSCSGSFSMHDLFSIIL